MRWEGFAKMASAARLHREAAKMTDVANKAIQEFLAKPENMKVLDLYRELQRNHDTKLDQEKEAAANLLSIMKDLDA